MWTFSQKIGWISESVRITRHLRTVEQELRAKNVGHLPPGLRRERIKNIARLRDYWMNGMYPKNRDFPRRRVPYFKDATGVPCAMAYLVEQSGSQDLVSVVARTDNHVYINDLSDGPVIEWINKSGLTKAEAARIQPTYDYMYRPDPATAYVVWGWFALFFLLLEWLAYKVASWIAPENKVQRFTAWFYFTLLTVSALSVVMILTILIGGPGDLIREFRQYFY